MEKMSYMSKSDESVLQILCAVALIGLALSLPFAAYYLLRHGFSTDILLILVAGTMGSYALVTSTFILYCLSLFICRLIESVILIADVLPLKDDDIPMWAQKAPWADRIRPGSAQEDDSTLTWAQSFKKAAVLLIACTSIFAILFLLILLFSAGSKRMSDV